MEGGAAGDSRAGWGDPQAGICVIPPRLPPMGSPAGAVPVSQQPVTIVQHLPGPGAVLAPPRDPHPSGELRDGSDLIELMMIQNSQMHQVVMNSLTVAALTSFGFGPAPPAAQALAVPLQTEEEEEEAVVFHHHYMPYPGPVPIMAWQDPPWDGGPAVRHVGSSAEDEDRAVPPPPPPSATGTVGPNVPPAAEYYDMVQHML
ncbi:proline-rich protein 29 [Pithys albifrons albifrons]|uniref:proline-rich protein 29 n=1 Tax=Pithys albifrons albifrons TaxID=3385563 RepID=UPI003A5CFD0C